MKTRLALAGLILLSRAAALRADDAKLPMPKDPSLPTLWIIGDSTVHQNPGSKLRSWGDLIHKKFDETKLNVVNRAIPGRSSRTFITEGRWDDVMKTAKAGDVLFMQFGHNDSSPLVDADRCRGSIQGIGDDTQETYNNVTKQNETVHTYGWYLKKMINDAKAKGMQVVVFSPVPRCPKAGKAPEPTTEATGYETYASEVAKETGVAYVDLHSIVFKTYAAMKPEDIKAKFFTTHDGTHNSQAGAELNEACVIEGIKGLANDPVAAYLKG